MKKMSAGGPPSGVRLLGPGGPGGPGKGPSPADMIEAQIDILSGIKADAILYLGPPQTLTQSPIEPSVYLDLDYFKELDRRAQCCTPGGRRPDWEHILQQSSAVASKFQAH
jgi:hypothetical protein